ncbi:hypothetical protein SL267_21970 [Serratia marcescens]|nr:hypothetical protein SL267_21970 [Serratia marcescens]
MFANDCSGCHRRNGPGRQSEYASLVGSTAVNDPQGRSVVQAILKGTSISVGERHEMMPAFGSAYSDEEVAAVANFVVGHFGDKQARSPPNRWRSSASSRKRRGRLPRCGVTKLRRDITRLSFGLSCQSST